jgi:hypothetical protein
VEGEWLSVYLLVLSAQDEAAQRSALSDADDVLSKLDTVLTRMTPYKQLDFLVRFIENRARFLGKEDSKMREFLELLVRLTTFRGHAHESSYTIRGRYLRRLVVAFAP